MFNSFYQVRGAINQPKGVQKSHIPLLIGGGGEQVTLKLVARYADVCNIYGDLETIRRKFAVSNSTAKQLAATTTAFAAQQGPSAPSEKPKNRRGRKSIPRSWAALALPVQ